MATITFGTHKFIRKVRDRVLKKARLKRWQMLSRKLSQNHSPVTPDYLDSRLFELENRMVKWEIGLALGKVAVIAALVKLL